MARILGVWASSLLAILLLSALAAQGVNAAEFTAFNTNLNQDEPAEIVGASIGSTLLYEPGAGGPQVTCANATYSGSTEGKEATPSIFPAFSECHAILFGEPHAVTVRTNECSYQLHIDVVVVKDMEYTGHVSLHCPEGKSIEMEIPSTGCIFTIPTSSGGVARNQNLVNVGYAVTTHMLEPTDVDLVMAINNLFVVANKGILVCGKGAGGGGGNYFGEATLQAFNGVPEQIDFDIKG